MQTNCCNNYCLLFEKVDPPSRLYLTEELFARRQFKTRYNWLLEQLLCSNRKARTVTLVRGPAALEKNQMLSSTMCVTMLILFVLLLVIAILVWIGAEGAGSIICMILVILCSCYPRISSLHRFLQV
jgi:hypothetical protein